MREAELELCMSDGGELCRGWGTLEGCRVEIRGHFNQLGKTWGRRIAQWAEHYQGRRHRNGVFAPLIPEHMWGLAATRAGVEERKDWIVGL